MRRIIAASVVAVATAIAALPAPTFATRTAPASALPGAPTDGPARQALTVADRVLDGRAAPRDPDASLALRDLRLALPRLAGEDRERARALLARPTDGAADRFGDGYATRSVTRKCSKFVCVHWVTRTSDKPPAGWGQTTLEQMNKVWKLEIGDLGYRKPLSDGTRGGNAKLDVYLKDVGSKFLYGYCAPEQRKYQGTYAGYCVLDDDFDPAQFGGVPALDSLKVTAAHEFFHAAQFGYDAVEDGWFMETTATWMEERYADGVNDNRQYLPAGQVGDPTESLDTWIFGAGNQYANWAFWEYLTERKGNGLVKSVWNKAATYRGAPDKYSIQALVDVLKTRGGFKSTFAAYSSALTLPGEFWEEGAAWPLSAPIHASHTLTASVPSVSPLPVGLSHLTSRNVRFTPDSSLTGSTWKLQIRVDGPAREAAPVAYVRVQKTDGTFVRSAIALNQSGIGSKTVGFDFAAVSHVTLTLGNASTRYRCWIGGSTYSCSGIPRDDNKAFSYTATALQP